MSRIGSLSMVVVGNGYGRSCWGQVQGLVHPPGQSQGLLRLWMLVGDSGMCAVQAICQLQGGVFAGVSGLGGILGLGGVFVLGGVLELGGVSACTTLRGRLGSTMSRPLLRDSGLGELGSLNAFGGLWGVSTSPGVRSQLPQP